MRYSPLKKPGGWLNASNGITPQKHASWLNMAESELGILFDQCVDRRIPDQQLLAKEIKAWQAYRNQHCRKANWQFTTADARIQLRHLYPTF